MKHLKNFRLFESLDENLISELQDSLNKASQMDGLYEVSTPGYALGYSPEGDAVIITKSTDKKSITGIVDNGVITFQGVDTEVNKWSFASGRFEYLAQWIVESSPISISKNERMRARW